MSRHSEKCSTAAAYAERIFQQLEDNRPSDAPADFSDSSPEEPIPGEPKTTDNTSPEKSTPSESKTRGDQSQPVRSNTVGSPDVYAQSKDASYEARSRRTEELALDAERREQEVTAAGGTPPQASTPDVQQETPFFCPACIADDEKEWVEALELEADS